MKISLKFFAITLFILPCITSCGEGSNLTNQRAMDQEDVLLADVNLDSKIKNLIIKAREGASDAQFELGVLYGEGKGIGQNSSKRNEWWQKAAEQGNPDAQRGLAQCYEFGDGTEKHPQKAIEWYQKAFKGYQEAAEQGNSRAQFMLGLMYATGQGGISKDLGKASEYYHMSANSGYEEAQLDLGLNYEFGLTVTGTKDLRKAIEWYQKAAEQGNSAAQLRLGIIYYTGKGVSEDSTKAFEWLLKAAKHGDAQAQCMIGYMYHIGKGVTKDLFKAVEWLQKSAEQGHVEAQNSLGMYCAYGEGVIKDGKKAFEWFLKAAEQGHAPAQHNIAALYKQGLGVTKDEVESLAWNYIAVSTDESVMVNGFSLKEAISSIERKLGTNATLMAQQRAKEILRKLDAKKSTASDSATATTIADSQQDHPKSAGTGAFISKNGLILTAAHVVAKANSVKVLTEQGVFSAKILQIDRANDIAVLQCKGTFQPLTVSDSKGVRLGQGVFTIGFPQTELQGFSPKFTKGEISSTGGMQDDPRHWQISVPVQPGNSGGPLLDESGAVVGIVVAGLDAIEVAKLTGSVPQNVNYAVKSAYIKPLLDEYDISVSPVKKSGAKMEDLVEQAQKSIVMILVY